MPDSGDAAMLGAVIGGAAGYTVSDGHFLGTVLGAGAGLVVTGHTTEDLLGEAELEEIDL